MFKKRLFSILCLSILTMGIYAQVEEPVRTGSEKNEKAKEKLPFKQRLVFGGDLGLSFGTITYIKLAPIVGYKVTDRLTTGLGPIYIYEKYKYYNLQTSTYGGKAILSFAIIRSTALTGVLGMGDIVLHAENEVVNVEPLYFDTGISRYFFGDRLWIDNLLLGGGLSQSLGGSFGVSLFVLWDVTKNEFSPYSNPILKFGFYF